MRAKKILLVAAAVTVAGLPLTSYAATTSTNTTVTATVNASISINSLTPANVGVTLNPTGAGVVSSASQAVEVSTNAPNGFDLLLKDADATLTLGATIAAHAGTMGTPTVLANNTWGFAIAGAPFSGSYSVETDNASSSSLWAGITASDQLLRDVASPGTTTTTVWYGVRATTATSPGSYADTITYTATTNP